jgi:DNA-binding NarL/FixJ family response regulator
MQDPGDLTIVVVDDVPHICELVTALLNTVDHVVVLGTSNSIATALESIIQLQPDAVMLDISMPSFEEMRNGIDVLRWIKQHYPATAVIMLTNRSEPIYQQACQTFGAYAFLDKSSDAERLPAVMTQLVNELVRVHR